MKTFIYLLLIALFISCGKKESTNDASSSEVAENQSVEVTEVARFDGIQVTGVTVSSTGRVFANFPRWRSGVEYAVVEVQESDKSFKPYPNLAMNSWRLEDAPSDEQFMCVQSVVAQGEKLYILDTRNPLFQGVKDTPRVYVYNLSNDQLEKVYYFGKGVFKPNSYVNDLRIDEQLNRAYFTDSGEAGLIILELGSGNSRRILDNHTSTLAEVDHLTIDGKAWNGNVHADGIALDTKNNKLYYHSLTGYHLYAIPTEMLDKNEDQIEQSVEKVKKTAAPDGMIFDAKGNLYFADLERHQINYLTPEGEEKILLSGDQVRWADTFSIYQGYLYYTNSRIHEAGEDVSQMQFTIHKIKL